MTLAMRRSEVLSRKGTQGPFQPLVGDHGQ